MEIKQEEIEKFIKKVEESKKMGLDLSADEDLSVALMNLISIEEHFFFTGVKTGKGEYFDLLNRIREIRKELLKRIIKDYEGEIWCISKHLLASSMRLIEVGTKYLSEGKKDEAEDLFHKAYELWSLFWGINLKIIDIGEVKKNDNQQVESLKNEQKTNLLDRLKNVINKALDCCRE